MFFIFVLSIYPLRAQNMLPLLNDSSIGNGKQYFVFSGVADYQSTSIGKDITKSFFYGGLIDTEMKLRSSNRHDEINRFGLEMNAEFDYRNEKLQLFKDSLIGLIVKGGIYNFSSLIYSKDLFDYQRNVCYNYKDKKDFKLGYDFKAWFRKVSKLTPFKKLNSLPEENGVNVVFDNYKKLTEYDIAKKLDKAPNYRHRIVLHKELL